MLPSVANPPETNIHSPSVDMPIGLELPKPVEKTMTVFLPKMFDNALKKLASIPVSDDDGHALAQAHNFHFDPRTTDERKRIYYQDLDLKDDSPEHLRQRHGRYIAEHVWNPPCPATFRMENRAAFLEKLESKRGLIRMVRLDPLLGLQVTGEKELKDPPKAFKMLTKELALLREKPTKKTEKARIDADAMLSDWFDAWNKKRSLKPRFAALEGEDIQTLIGGNDWPELLRNRMGLSHLIPGHAPLYVALMRYTVGDVLNAAKAQGIKTPFAIPTVLDQPINEYFFPAPLTPFQGERKTFGRTMSLQPSGDDTPLMAELLHVKLDYEPKHMIKTGQILQLRPTHPIWQLRNSHLAALRQKTREHHYGKEIPERSL